MTTAMGSRSQDSITAPSPADKARFIREHLPPRGLFAGQQWRISPDPFPLPRSMVEDFEWLGRILLRFYQTVNLLYRQSVRGKEPRWVAEWLDKGKPAELIELQRSPGLKNDVPRVIRPDLMFLGNTVAITELDSVPGGIGLTAWLNRVYDRLTGANPPATTHPGAIVGGADGMLRGFEAIFGPASRVHIVVSEEAATYRPEMEWIAQQLGPSKFHVQDQHATDFAPEDAVYRFFELFDVGSVDRAQQLFNLASQHLIRLTPPPKAFFEEKMLLALLWNRNLHGFWRRELGARFFERMRELVPYTWVVDPTPLPAHGAIPELNLTDWQQLKHLSQRERQLILKISGFADTAWGARGVYLGSDLSLAEWSAAVDLALGHFETNPFVLQRYYKPDTVEVHWFDFEAGELRPMKGRVRLCPYYFVAGEGDGARAWLGGVLATICPAEKKIIHGMEEAILAPCAYA